MNLKKLMALSASLLTASTVLPTTPAQAQYYGSGGMTFNNPMSASSSRIIQSRMDRRRLQRRLAQKRAAQKPAARQPVAKKRVRRAR